MTFALLVTCAIALSDAPAKTIPALDCGGQEPSVVADVLTQVGYFEPLGLGSGFVAHSAGDVAYVGSDGITIPGSGQERQALRIAFAGGSPSVHLKASQPLQGKSNYLLGRNPLGWRVGIPHYGRVRYEGLYQGVDAEVYLTANGIEYDLTLNPGARLGDVRLRIDGARALSVDGQGNLLISFSGRTLVQASPRVYQFVGGMRRDIRGAYRLDGKNQVGLMVGAHDPAVPLVIDPLLNFSRSIPAQVAGAAVDRWGNVYIAGGTHFDASQFRVAVAGGWKQGSQTSKRDEDAFVTKFDAHGDIVYTTLLGGDQDDKALALGVDTNGAVYITGLSWSKDFPLVKPAQRARAEYGDIPFLAKLSPDGQTIEFSTYLGGSGWLPWAIAVDSSGQTYVGGYATFPEGVLFRVAPDGQTSHPIPKIRFHIAAVAVDVADNVYLVGNTRDNQLPVVNAIQPHCAGGTDGVVGKIGRNSESFAYLTYLGGGADEYAQGIAVDPLGSSVVVGMTRSGDFPLVNPLQRKTHPGEDGFLAKLTPEGNGLVFSTILGGIGPDSAQSVALDREGNAYLAGMTKSPDFPLKNPIRATGEPNLQSLFLSKVSRDGNTLLFSSYVAPARDFPAARLAVADHGDAYVAANTFGPLAAVYKVSTAERPLADLTMSQTVPPVKAKILDFEITISNRGPDAATGVTILDRGPAGYRPCLDSSCESGASVKISQGRCEQAFVAGQYGVRCELGSLAVGARATFHMVVAIDKLASYETVNRVYLSANEGDPNPRDNVSWVEVK